jgi:hypothetical protein
MPARLVFPALRWRAETGFDHEDTVVREGLARGVGGFILFGGTVESISRLGRPAGRC